MLIFLSQRLPSLFRLYTSQRSIYSQLTSHLETIGSFICLNTLTFFPLDNFTLNLKAQHDPFESNVVINHTIRLLSVFFFFFFLIARVELHNPALLWSLVVGFFS